MGAVLNACPIVVWDGVWCVSCGRGQLVRVSAPVSRLMGGLKMDTRGRTPLAK